jgi:DNA-binding response OmpR family regulator
MDSKKILVVDDDQDMLLLLNARLKAKGYQVVFANDGLTCISMARKEKPDLILLDLGLPAGDGFVTLERLRGLLPVADTPVVVFTAQGEAEARERAMSLGADAFFEKSVDKEELLAAIWRLLDGDGLAHL